jgi:hypothetical protein
MTPCIISYRHWPPTAAVAAAAHLGIVVGGKASILRRTGRRHFALVVAYSSFLDLTIVSSILNAIIMELGNKKTR